MDYAALQVEIAKPEYKGMDDAEIITALEDKTAAVPIDVPARDVRAVLYARGKLTAVTRKAIAAKNGADNSDAAFACLSLYEIFSEGVILPMTNPDVAAQCQSDLTLIVGAGVLTSEDVASIMALAVNAIPWPESNDCAGLQAEHLAIARKL